MPLEDSSTIDIVTQGEDGRLCLVITDSGVTTDPDTRFSMLVKKVTTYLGYILSADFQTEHPGLKPGDAKILALSSTEPDERMIRFNRLRGCLKNA